MCQTSTKKLKCGFNDLSGEMYALDQIKTHNKMQIVRKCAKKNKVNIQTSNNRIKVFYLYGLITLSSKIRGQKTLNPLCVHHEISATE